MITESKTNEGRLRRLAKKHNLWARKSRRNGLWWVLDPRTNVLLTGADPLGDGLLTAEEAIEWVQDYTS
jgi:hypothetical protein